MTALVPFFYRAACPRLNLLLGVIALVTAPMLAARLVPEMALVLSLPLVIVMVIFGCGMFFEEEAWPLLLPTSRRRIYGALCRGVLASVVPGVSLVAVGLVLAGRMQTDLVVEPFRALHGVVAVTLLVMVVLALLPAFWRWSPVAQMALLIAIMTVPLLLFAAAVILSSAPVTAIWIVLELLGIVLFYIGGRVWFVQCDTSSQGRVAAPMPPKASAAAAEPPTHALLSPNAALFIRTCWLRGGFSLILPMTLAYAFIVGTSDAMNEPLRLRLVWVGMLAMGAGGVTLWLRSQLDVLLPLRRGVVYQTFTTPLLVLLFIAVCAIGQGRAANMNETVLLHDSFEATGFLIEQGGRGARLPVDELLGGSSPERWEQRAPIVAEQVAHLYANRYGVSWSAGQLVKQASRPSRWSDASAGGGEPVNAPIVTTADLTHELRHAMRWESVHMALLAVVLVLLGGALGVPGVWVYRHPRLAQWMGRVIPLLMPLVMAWAILTDPRADWLLWGRIVETADGVPLIPLRTEGVMRRFLLAHRYMVTAGLAGLALALHWRNHRAFRQTEWTTFGSQRWAAGRRRPLKQEPR